MYRLKNPQAVVFLETNGKLCVSTHRVIFGWMKFQFPTSNKTIETPILYQGKSSANVDIYPVCHKNILPALTKGCIVLYEGTSFVFRHIEERQVVNTAFAVSQMSIRNTVEKKLNQHQTEWKMRVSW